MSKKCVLAVDVGGSKYITGFIDNDGRILCSKREEWTSYEADKIIAQLVGSICDTLSAHAEFTPESIGMTIPGIANPEKGVWVGSPLGRIRNFAVCDFLQKKTGLPVYIDNDANACALAELYFGTCRNFRNFLYMTVSSGIGGAFILNRSLYYGTHGGAGEIGLTVAVKNSDRKNEHGQRGLLELYAATGGLAQNYMEAGGSLLANGKLPGGKEIAQLARQNDKAALKAFELEGYYLGSAIANVNNLMDLEGVVIGGGLSLAFDLYEDSMQAQIKAEDSQGNSSFRVMPTVLGYEGALVGAATVALLKSKVIEY